MWYIRWNIIQPQGRRKSFILTTKMDLEGIMLSEISQTKEDILYGRTYMWNLKKKKKSHTHKTETRKLVVSGEVGSWGWG